MSRRLLFYSLIFWSLIYTSCKSDPAQIAVPPTPPKDTYLDSYVLVRSVTSTDVSNLFSPFQSVYQDVAQIIPYIKSGVKVYSIRYNTTLGTKKLVASGLVCIPDGGGTYPLLSFQNGTNTVYANAPTSNPADYNAQLLTGFSSTGFVLAFPDYLGFGSSKEVFHPYLHAESTITSVLDMFRAIKEMATKTDLGFKLSTDLYLMGYSQGGWSTLQIDKAVETKYSSEFNLKAVGCGAGPYNLSLINDLITTTTEFPQPYYVAYMLKAYKSVTAISNPYSDIFNEPYASRIDGLFNGLNSGTYINGQLTTSIPQLFTNEYRTTVNTAAKFKDIRDALVANSIAAWRIKAPLYLTHGTADTDVNPLTTQQLYQDLQKIDPSLPVTYLPMQGMNHGQASAPSLLYFVKKFLQIKGP